MRSHSVKKAVIPVAGLGTRFLPVTKSIPKEMIPIIDVPMIQYIVEEAVSAGIRDIVLVTARHKEAVENYFDYNYELEETLLKRKKSDLYEASHSVGDLCNIITIRQKNPLGLGHAILCAAPVVGEEPFAVLLGDDLVVSEKPCIGQLLDVFEKEKASVVGIMEVPPGEVSKYGIIDGIPLKPGLFQVRGLVEKPEPSVAPSHYAIPGRYVLNASIFEYIKQVKPGKGGEIQLTDGLELMAKREKLLAYQFSGTRYDTGDRLGYLDATLHFGLKRKDIGQSVRELISKYYTQLQK